MANRAKGANAERELVRLFTENGWRAVRVAGSGVNEDSPCDVIAAKAGKRGYTIEAKSSKKNSIYITKQQIEDFLLFSNQLGLTPVIALRFNYEGWLFIFPEKLRDSGKFWVVSKRNSKNSRTQFSQFFE